MKKEEIMKRLGKEKDCENFRFNFSDFVCDEFQWEENTWDEKAQRLKKKEIWETVNIHNIELPRECIELLISEKENNIETFSWSGTIIERNGEKCCDPAYGGESNTDGIPEMGSICISLEDIFDANSIENA